MRGLGTIVAAALVAGLIAGVLQLELGIWFDAHEEFIAVMMGQVLIVLIAAVLLAIALLGFRTATAVDRAAIGLAVVLVLAGAALEAFVLLTSGVPSLHPRDVLAEDGPIALEVLAPALLAILVEWWVVRRHLKKRQRLQTAA